MRARNRVQEHPRGLDCPEDVAGLGFSQELNAMASVVNLVAALDMHR
jgi:hypothetical protein